MLKKILLANIILSATLITADWRSHLADIAERYPRSEVVQRISREQDDTDELFQIYCEIKKGGESTELTNLLEDAIIAESKLYTSRDQLRETAANIRTRIAIEGMRADAKLSRVRLASRKKLSVN